MPTGLCEILLGGAIASAVGGAAKGIGGAIEGGKKRKHEKELETIHQTDEGFEDMDLVQADPRFDLTSQKPPVLFPNTRKKPIY